MLPGLANITEATNKTVTKPGVAIHTKRLSVSVAKVTNAAISTEMTAYISRGYKIGFLAFFIIVKTDINSFSNEYEQLMFKFVVLFRNF